MYDLHPGAAIGQFPYRIEKKIGGREEGMSEVYLASVSKPFQRQQGAAKVVLKIAGADKLEINNRSIRNEEEFLPRLDHPGVIRILPILSEENRERSLGYRARSALSGEPWFCILEYIHGYSLASLLYRQVRRLSTYYVVTTVIDIAEVVAYLHSQQITHLDIKPSNILFRQQNFLRRNAPILIDFGLCRKSGQKSSGGTPGYMAPERRKEYADVPAHPSMDIYALGALLQEMLDGRLVHTQKVREFLRTTVADNWQERPDINSFLSELRGIQASLSLHHRII